MITQPNNPLVSDKCDSCEFCVWNSELHTYVCEIKGCYNGSKFKEYKGVL